MARYALVQSSTGFVVNVIEWSGDENVWQAPSGYEALEAGDAGPGWTYDAGTQTFTPPPDGVVPANQGG